MDKPLVDPSPHTSLSLFSSCNELLFPALCLSPPRKRHTVLSFLSRLLFPTAHRFVCKCLRPLSRCFSFPFPLVSPVSSPFPTCHRLIKAGAPTEPMRRDPRCRCPSVLAPQSAKKSNGFEVVCRERWAESFQDLTQSWPLLLKKSLRRQAGVAGRSWVCSEHTQRGKHVRTDWIESRCQAPTTGHAVIHPHRELCEY